MVGGEHAILKKYLTQAKLGAPAKFYGDIAVADGTTADEFFPWKRGVFKVDSRSTNVFDNPLLDEYKQTIWYAAGGGLLAGLVLMFLALWFLRRAPQR